MMNSFRSIHCAECGEQYSEISIEEQHLEVGFCSVCLLDALKIELLKTKKKTFTIKDLEEIWDRGTRR